MRKLWLAVVCLVVVLGGACKKGEPEASMAALVLPSPCKPGAPGRQTCTITIEEKGGACTVYPQILRINSRDRVIFATADHDYAKGVKIVDKGDTRLHFQFDKPNEIGKGKSHDGGEVTGNPYDFFAYTVYFKGTVKDVCDPPIDPVICIKDAMGGSNCVQIEVPPLDATPTPTP